MMHWLYLLGLLFGMTGMAVIDYRFKLALWYDRRRTLYTVLSSVFIFIAWDLVGIANGVFFAGNSAFFLPYRIVSEFPIEELFFLTLLCYCTLIIYRFGVQRWQRT